MFDVHFTRAVKMYVSRRYGGLWVKISALTLKCILTEYSNALKAESE
jgi:hypothetical protein